MYELVLMVIVVASVVLAIRRGKPKLSDEPVIIDRTDFHATLAPQLQCATRLIESIVHVFMAGPPRRGDIATQYFTLRDAQAVATDAQFYLLAVTRRGGRLYFQAIRPSPLIGDRDSHLNNMREFSEAVLLHHPLTDPVDMNAAAALSRLVVTTARAAQIEATPLVK